jgi:hypothetical protein
MLASRYLFTSVVHFVSGAPLLWLEDPPDVKKHATTPLYVVAAVRIGLVWAAAGLVIWARQKAAWIVGGTALFIYAIECSLWYQAEKKRSIVVPHIVAFVVCLDPLNYALDTVGSGPRLLAQLIHGLLIISRMLAVATVAIVVRMYPTYVAAWSCYKHAPIAKYDQGTCPKLHLGQGDNMPDWVCTDDAYKYDNGCLLEPENASWNNYPAIVHYLLLGLSVDIAAYVLLALVRTTPAAKLE